MDYEQNKDILDAIAEMNRWLDVEGRPPTPAAVARELVKIGRTGSDSAQRALHATFALLAARLEVNAGNIAWIMRDGRVGFPDSPTFDF